MPILVDKIVYKYSKKTVYETLALDGVSLKIDDGEFIGIIGHSGSGKSTLAMHLNGLLRADSGSIYYNGEDIYEKGYDLKSLRTQVGLVFQYPEHQLFAETVFDDVKFGPLNQGLSDKEAALRAYEALSLVGFPEEMFDQPPFALSGGQKRLAAIAGVLSMKPVCMILDEPTAGLDPNGRKEILRMLRGLHETTGRTIVLISHSMEDVAEYVKRLIVMNKGTIVFDDSPYEVFSHSGELEQMALAVPQPTYLAGALIDAGFEIENLPITVDEAVSCILKSLK